MNLVFEVPPREAEDTVYGRKKKNSSLGFRKIKEDEQKKDFEQYYKEISMITS